MLLPSVLSAQSFRQLQGVVVDERNLPLPGATVALNHDSQVIQTGKKGCFHVALPDTGAVYIEIRYMGYDVLRREVPAAELTDTVVFRLIPQAQQLSEVQIHNHFAEQRQKEDPLSVEVVEPAYIRQNISGSLMQTLDRLPGVTTIDIGSGQSKPMIRGLAFNRVVVAEHGVKHEAQQWGADHGLEIDQYAVERLEVIKGPLSLKYGSDAIGGLIEIGQAAIPEAGSAGGSADLTGNSNNGSVGGSMLLFKRYQEWYVKTRFSIVDYADYRVPADSVTINSYRVPLVNHRLRNTAGEEFNGGLTIGHIGNRFSATLFLSDYYATSGFFANALGITPLVTDSTYDRSIRDIQTPYQWVNHAKAIFSVIVFHGKIKTETTLGWQYNFRRELNPYYQHGYMPPVLPDTLGFQPGLAREFRKQTGSLNYRSAFPVADKHTLTAGLSLEFQHNRIGGWDFIIPSFDQMTGGVFLLGQSKISERLIMEAGIRYDLGYISILPWSDWFPTPVIEEGDTLGYQYAIRAESLNRFIGNLSWSAGVNYSTPSVTWKANLGKSFRMPIPKELAVNGVNYHYFIYEKGDPSLSPEVSYQLDAGVSWRRPRFAVEMNPFVNYFPNYIYLNPTYHYDYIYGAGNQIYQYTQCEVFRTGGELHIHYKPFRFLMAGLIAEYVYARQLSGEKKGFTLPFSPPASFIVNLKYLPVFRKTLAHSFISLDLNFIAAQNQIVPPEVKTPGSFTADISLGTGLVVYRQTITFSLSVRNLFNTTWYNATSFYRILDIPEPGRTIILNISIPFSFNRK